MIDDVVGDLGTGGRKEVEQLVVGVMDDLGGDLCTDLGGASRVVDLRD